MTTEQLKELAEVLSVLSAKSSVLKERDELRALMEENQQTACEEAEVSFSSHRLDYRIREYLLTDHLSLSGPKNGGTHKAHQKYVDETG